MTWIHLPKDCESFPCSQVEGDLTKESPVFFALERSATWNGTSRLAKSWYQQYKKAKWTMRLFGQISPPSIAHRGVASWIASLAGSPASRSARPLEAEKTQRTCGLKCFGASLRSSRHTCSLKTSPSLLLTPPPSTYTDSATASLRQQTMQQMRALGIADRDGGYLLPTPTATANHLSPSMLKWPAYRRMVELGVMDLPKFWEWMMGWPDLSTHGVPRTSRLMILGNGVVPAQAALALRSLIDDSQG